MLTNLRARLQLIESWNLIAYGSCVALTRKPCSMHFPSTRLRRPRMQDWSRRLVEETILTPNDLILPVFITEGQNVKEPINSLSGVHRVSLDLLVETAKEAESLGIPLLALFPAVPQHLKTEDAKEALNPDSLVCQAIKLVKQNTQNIGVMCDIALDLYTSHGHDGILINGEIANDATVEVLVQQALNYASAGCDVLGPSDMMDGRITAIRHALENHQFINTQIFSYAAKYASALYGPYRDAVQSSGNLAGASKSTYQQNPANSAEALHEVAMDINEGADAFIVKPAMLYMDIIKAVKDKFQRPTIGYQVSGEYAMIKSAAEAGCIDGDKVMREALLCLKRAGCDAILTYDALNVAKALQSA